LGPNLGVFPLEQTHHVGAAKSEHPRLTNGEIYSKNPTYVITIHNVTDRQTTCDRNTALCTKVHRAVKIKQTDDTNIQCQYSDNTVGHRVRVSTNIYRAYGL